MDWLPSVQPHEFCILSLVDFAERFAQKRMKQEQGVLVALEECADASVLFSQVCGSVGSCERFREIQMEADWQAGSSGEFRRAFRIPHEHHSARGTDAAFFVACENRVRGGSIAPQVISVDKKHYDPSVGVF